MGKFKLLFVELMKDGGPVMWIILGCALIALLVFFTKVFQFHRDEINVRELLHGLTNVLKRNGINEALALCQAIPGPAARLLGAAIVAHNNGDADIGKAVDEVALDELPKLERGVTLIGTLGFILPLLGFLGTVLGMLGSFEATGAGNFVNSAALAGAMKKAILTTAAGLTTAIPCYLAYNYLVSRVNAITLDMEKAALEITVFFSRHGADEKESEAGTEEA